MAVNPKPNTQPIYPKEIFTWRAKLTNQITPNAPISNTLLTTLPVKLGTARECGALVWAIQGGVGEEGKNGLNIIIYSRRTGDTEITPRGVLTLSADAASGLGIYQTPLPIILPNAQKGLHFEAEEEVFVGLYDKSFILPVVVYMIGGHY